MQINLFFGYLFKILETFAFYISMSYRGTQRMVNDIDNPQNEYLIHSHEPQIQYLHSLRCLSLIVRVLGLVF